MLLFSRAFSFKSEILVISFSFIPIMTAAILLGPKYSCAIAGLGDLIGAILFPFGPYFPGFTVTAALSGLIYGLILYNKNNSPYKGKNLILRLILSSIAVLIIIDIPIQSFLIYLISGKAFIAIMSTRVITKLIMLPIQVIVMFLLNFELVKLKEKYLEQ